MRIRLSSRRLWLGAVAGAAVAVGTTVALGSVSGGGVIHACYTANNVRLIDPSSTDPNGSSCKPNETAIDWNQQGPPGAKGPTGAAGQNGAPGAKGATGAKGTTGPKGDTGAAGAAGTAGARGPTGAKGATGPAGPSATNLVQIVTQPVDVPPHVVSPAVHADAVCPTGMVAVSGGYFIINLDPNAPPGALISWRPSPNTWEVFFYNPSASLTIEAQTIAYCAPSS